MRNAFKRCAIIEVLSDPHIIIERNIFRHVTEPRSGLERLLENIEAGDGGAAGSGRHESGQDAHGRCFAGAIWPEKTHDLTLAHLETQVPDRGLTGVSLG